MASTIGNEVRKSIKDQGFGVYLIVLLPEYKFLRIENNTAILKQDKGLHYDILERIVCGLYKDDKQFGEYVIDIEVLPELNVTIPYNAIKDYKRLAGIEDLKDLD